VLWFANEILFMSRDDWQLNVDIIQFFNEIVKNMYSKILNIYNFMVMLESYENKEIEWSRYCINPIEPKERSYNLFTFDLKHTEYVILQVNLKIRWLTHLNSGHHHHHHHHHYHLCGLVRNKFNSVFLFLHLEYSFMRNTNLLEMWYPYWFF
jgi:hypothetical protein